MTILPELLAAGGVAGIAAALAARAARGRRLASPLPRDPAPEPPDALLAWVGTGTAEARRGDGWARQPAQDYEFAVVQRRFREHWESVKMMNRRHPDYDGSAGARDQVHFFRLGFSRGENGDLALALDSSMGAGRGHADAGLRSFEFTLDIAAPALARRFMPFDRLAFTQRYAYDAARLEETITLTKAGRPAFRMTEEAAMLSQTALSGPPGQMAA